MRRMGQKTGTSRKGKRVPTSDSVIALVVLNLMEWRLSTSTSCKMSN